MSRHNPNHGTIIHTNPMDRETIAEFRAIARNAERTHIVCGVVFNSNGSVHYARSARPEIMRNQDYWTLSNCIRNCDNATRRKYLGLLRDRRLNMAPNLPSDWN